MKCGTTALWRNLSLHPDIHMGKNPDDPKTTSTEIRFWNNGGPHRTWRNGIDWYKGLFDYSKVCGEKCANYIESPKAISRMREHIPDLKLVLCVRQPTDRMLSEFWMHHTKPDKIAKFSGFAAESGPRMRSLYLKQLKRSVLLNYNISQIYVVIQERMAADTLGEINKLCNWLGLSPFNAKVAPVDFDKRDDDVAGLRVWETDHKVDMSSYMRKYLNDYFRPQNERFFDWLGHSIPEWDEGYAL